MKISAPRAEKRPKRITLHGDTRIDEYMWLQDKTDPAVRKHIELENRYADKLLSGTKKLQSSLYKEIKARMKEDDMSVPVKDGPYYYYTRVKKGKQYAIHCRKLVKGGKEEILLDENVLAKGQKYFSLDIAEVSPDHGLLAYSTDTDGSERYTMRIKDLHTGKLLSDTLYNVGNMEWAEDGAHLFYTIEEHPRPPHKILLHKIGDKKDTLIYEEKDPQWYVSVGKSRSREYIFLYGANFNTTEVRFIPASAPHTTPVLFAPRKKEVKYFPDHHEDSFYILSNEKAVNYKILRTAVASPQKKYWKPWISHSKDRALSGFSAYESFFLLNGREGGSEHAFIVDPVTKKTEKIHFPEDEHSIFVWGSEEYDSKTVRITYQSLLSPKTVYDYEVETKKLKVRKQQKIKGWDPKKYVSKRLWVKSGSVKVPVTIAYPKTLKRDGSAPMLLEAYGSYGITSDPVFSITKVSLLQRGWVIGTAHPRGGGEMGWNWHKQAKLLNKHRTYDDMLAVISYIDANKYSSRKRMALVGGSAGGMMVGAVLNRKPDAVGAAIAYVPAADIVTSMLDTSLGGTLLHYDEVGDPRKRAHYFYLKRTSPYENVKDAPYPHMLVRANMNDIRTPYWEAAKWVARLREHTTSNYPVILKTETVAGHFGKSGRYAWIKERAFDFAFLMSVLAPDRTR